jgi:hypothetical protein
MKLSAEGGEAKFVALKATGFKPWKFPKRSSESSFEKCASFHIPKDKENCGMGKIHPTLSGTSIYAHEGVILRRENKISIRL